MLLSAYKQSDHASLSQTQTHLLHLPTNVRQCIYELLEVPCEHYFNINQLLQAQPQEYRRRIPGLSSAHSLLLTCRALYEEIRDILYGRNHFIVEVTEYGDLDVMRRLQPATLSQLTALTIRARLRACKAISICSNRNTIDPIYPSAQLPLGLEECYIVTEAKIAKEWLALWDNHLHANLTTAKAEICFIFDSTTLKIAREVSSPFWAGIPGMFKHCTIRLAVEPNKQIRKLVKLSIDRASCTGTGPGKHTQPFRFMDLPAELRDKILAFTDLVTPNRAVWWTPDRGLRPILTTPPIYNIVEDDEDDDSSTKAVVSKEIPLSCTERTSPMGCFCASTHSADTSNPAYRCTCWSTPTALFLVSRLMRVQAARLFYSYNEVRLFPAIDRFKSFSLTDGHVPAILYFRKHAPRDDLQHLRRLEIIFPPWLPSSPSTNFDRTTKAWKQWAACIVDLHHQAMFHNLSLRITFMTAYHDDNILGDDEAHLNRYRQAITDTDGLYYDVLSPLQGLNGLANLSVQLPCFQMDYRQLIEAQQKLLDKLTDRSHAST